MGSSVRAVCSCGYDSDIQYIGGSMASFETLGAFPAFCREGSHLVTVARRGLRSRRPVLGGYARSPFIALVEKERHRGR